MHATHIHNDDIKLIAEKSDIVSVVSEQIKLKKKGRYFWGLCPFHEEKTPSFKVDPGMGLYYCFGCSEGGNVFNFLMKTQGLSFSEAVDTLARKFGITVRRTSSNVRYSKTDRMYKINNEAKEFFFGYIQSPKGKEAIQYLNNRGFDLSTISNFEIGLSPNSESVLSRHLAKKGFSEEEILSASLARQSGFGLRDFFINRLMFPIYDMHGRVVAFGGRTLKDSVPKYLNSSETDIFSKSSTLYGLFLSKKEIAAQNSAIIVEGYTDVIALNQAGIKNTVATLGTSLTLQHLKLLKRFAEHVILVFDGDKAGLAAAVRVLNISPPDVENISVLALPEKVDPADYVRTKSAKDFMELTGRAVPLVEFCLVQALNKYDSDSSQNKTRSAKAALEVLDKVKNPVIISESLKFVAEKLGIEEAALTLMRSASTGKRAASTNNLVDNKVPSLSALSGAEAAEKELIKLLLQPKIYFKYVDFFESDDFSNKAFGGCFEVLKNKPNGNKVNVSDLLNELEEADETRKLLISLSMEPVGTDASDIEDYAFGIYNRVKEFKLRRLIKETKNILEKMNPLKEKDYNIVFRKLIDLEAERRDLIKALEGIDGDNDNS